ncbi:MAG TPA: L,D-transpeptidase [Chitinophagaceae bacterium]|nr:L,D-transpeptidase [Chitinophagaceae bacterium]
MKLSIILTSVLLGTSTLSTNTPLINNFRLLTEAKKRVVPGNERILPVGSVYIVIDKSDYELNVYDEKGWFATYPVVFGNNSLDDKKMEGDRNTPEGVFHIISKKIHEKWDRFMALDYPTKESYEKFRLRKMRGEIPANARIGGGVGIHGTWPHDDYIIDRYNNWTMGCISMKNNDVEDLYSYLPVGTRITIRK